MKKITLLLISAGIVGYGVKKTFNFFQKYSNLVTYIPGKYFFIISLFPFHNYDDALTDLETGLYEINTDYFNEQYEKIMETEDDQRDNYRR